MAGETVAYETETYFSAVCSAEPEEHLTGRSEQEIDEIVAGHLIMTHNWTKANAQAYVAGKVYTPATIQNPPTA